MPHSYCCVLAQPSPGRLLARAGIDRAGAPADGRGGRLVARPTPPAPVPPDRVRARLGPGRCARPLPHPRRARRLRAGRGDRIPDSAGHPPADRARPAANPGHRADLRSDPAGACRHRAARPPALHRRGGPAPIAGSEPGHGSPAPDHRAPGLAREHLRHQRQPRQLACATTSSASSATPSASASPR